MNLRPPTSPLPDTRVPYTTRFRSLGVKRIVLGTVALREPALVKEACRRFPGHIAVGIDAREGYVAVEGWARTSTVKAMDLALEFEDSGVSALIYPDINREGAMGDRKSTRLNSSH